MKVVAVTRPYRSGPLRRPGYPDPGSSGKCVAMHAIFITNRSFRQVGECQIQAPTRRGHSSPQARRRRTGRTVRLTPAPGPRPREARVLLRDGEYEAIIDMCSVMAATVSGASPCAPLRNAEQGEMPKDMYSRPLSVSACASFGNWSLLGCSYPTAQP